MQQADLLTTQSVFPLLIRFFCNAFLLPITMLIAANSHILAPGVLEWPRNKLSEEMVAIKYILQTSFLFFWSVSDGLVLGHHFFLSIYHFNHFPIIYIRIKIEDEQEGFLLLFLLCWLIGNAKYQLKSNSSF